MLIHGSHRLLIETGNKNKYIMRDSTHTTLVLKGIIRHYLYFARFEEMQAEA